MMIWACFCVELGFVVVSNSNNEGPLLFAQSSTQIKRNLFAMNIR